MQTPPERTETIPGPVTQRVINGVRICRAVLIVAAVALIAFSFKAGTAYFAALAIGCLFAAFVKTRRVRSVLGAAAIVESMYFAADLFSAQGGSIVRDVVMGLSAILVSVAILRLRYWESPNELTFSTHWRWGLATAGLILIISGSLSIVAPVKSSQLTGSNTNSVCGSTIVHRNIAGGWADVNLPAISADCDTALQERTAFGVLQLELGIGAIWAGRKALRRLSVTSFVLGIALAVVSAGFGVGWNSAAVSNANKHNAAFVPWFQRYDATFSHLTLANNDLRTAVSDGNPQAVASACTQLESIDDSLGSSVNAWPSQYSDKQAQWKQFVTEHRADAESCVKSATSAPTATDLKASEWFGDSAATITKLHHVLSFQ